MTCNKTSALHAFLIGTWLAVLQVVMFLSLQMLMSSGYQTFVVVVLSWLIGAGVGVWLPAGRWHYALLGVSGTAPYLLQGLLALRRFDTSLIWIHAVLIALTALLAGQFFQQERRRFARIGTLFFWENNGFTVGLMIAGIGVFLWGRTFLLVAPAAGFVLVIASVMLRRQLSPTRVAA